MPKGRSENINWPSTRKALLMYLGEPTNWQYFGPKHPDYWPLRRFVKRNLARPRSPKSDMRLLKHYDLSYPHQVRVSTDLVELFRELRGQNGT